MSTKTLPMTLVLLWTAAACSSGPPRGYISRAELGDKWPLTVDEGVLDCTVYPSGGLRVVPKGVRFRTNDGRTYAVNGTERGRGFPDIDPIQRIAPPLYEFTPLERLPESERRAIFAESVACEDEADKKSLAKYPNPQDFERQLALYEKLTAQCKAAFRKRHNKLTDADHDAISAEGVALGWPPMSPMRMSVSPLIERGLKLCDS